jgi:3-oxoacyl-[acyl-carrier protein] reductase
LVESKTALVDGRVALVTGAGGGIGLGIARRLAAEGAAVVVNDVDGAAAEEAACSIEAAGGRAVAAPGDVRRVEGTDALAAAAEEAFGGLDIVVNNAGVTRDAMLHKMTDDEWDLVVEVCLRGTFNVCRSAARLLRRGKGEEIRYHRKVVNISSINGVYGAAANVNYSAAKAGVIGLTKALAREWAPQEINVNAVAPGFIEGTRLSAARDEESGLGIDPALLEGIVRSIPIGRPGSSEDVAALVAFLSSPGSDYLTGQVIELHGGLEIIRVIG